MTKTRSYSLRIDAHPNDGGYLAYFPALPGCQTWGDTYENAVLNAEEALSVYTDTLAENGDPIPEGLTADFQWNFAHPIFVPSTFKHSRINAASPGQPLADTSVPSTQAPSAGTST